MINLEHPAFHFFFLSAAYRKLLEGEEERLRINVSQSRTPTPSRGTKRKRVQYTSETVTQSESIITPDEVTFVSLFKFLFLCVFFKSFLEKCDVLLL